jgi:spore cortex formation protein SpoVR/YcgB (stage V sporulation)
MTFLLVYDRTKGLLIEQQAFEERARAMRARFRAEIRYAGRPEIEIVALTAESEQELRRTHGRYFLGLTELADRIGEPA